MTEMGKIDNIIARLPHSADKDEVRITDLIQSELLRTEWSRELFKKMRQLQIDFFRSAIQHLEDPELLHLLNQQLLERLAQESNSTIVSGKENLTGVKTPLMIATNHLGDYKLCTIKPAELNLDLLTDQIHPFSMYYAPYSPIAEQLKTEVSAAHIALLEPLHSIEKACRLVTIIVNKSGGGLKDLEKQTKSLFDKHPNTVLVIFPEGGTSGKRNQGGPYDLEEFHAGAFVIASNLGVSVLPVAKYFNPNRGYEIGILPPISPEKDRDRDYYQKIASTTQKDLQTWLDRQKGS